MITLFGSPRSSSGRCFWCLEELGTTYEAKPINFREKEHKSAAFLEINPNGKIPALIDGDFKIWESMAINSYLADKYKPELLGASSEERGLVQQWTTWAIAELQPPLIDVFIQTVFVPEAQRSQEVIDKGLEKLPGLLNTLNQTLEGKTHLLGDKFSLADLNVASVVGICEEIKFDTSKYSNITSWLKQLSERPAFKKYKELCV